MFEKFQSPALAGFAVVSHWLPFLLFSVYTGALADRYDPRRIIQLGMGLLHDRLDRLGLCSSSPTPWRCGTPMVLLVIHGFAGVLLAAGEPAAGARHSRRTSSCPARCG